MKLARTTASLAGAALIAAAASRQQHELDRRRARAQDRQDLWYDGDTFHVITFLRCPPGADVVDAIRELHRATRGYRDVEWIYAGKGVLTSETSSHLGHVEWDAVTVIQYPSAKDYHLVSRSLAFREALAPFPHTFSQGFVRPRSVNTVVPLALQARGVVQRLRGRPSTLPFEPAGRDDEDLGRQGSLDGLLTEPGLGGDGAVAVSLMKRAAPADRPGARRALNQMAGLMAEANCGPIHLGRAVAVDGEHHFDAVSLVYYPGLQFLIDMARSAFFRQVRDGAEPKDLQTVITAPILYRL